MLTILRRERCLILVLLISGLIFTTISYYNKNSATQIYVETIDFNERYSLVDINNASPLELERLPGIGPVLASDIVVYRKTKGRFRDPKELKKVKGIGDRKFDKIKDLIVINE